LEEASPRRFLPQIDHHYGQHHRAGCLINTGPTSAVCKEPPKIKPSTSAITGRPNSTTNHQPMPNRRNTVQTAPTPARPSAIQVTH
jgi:hypothetical protein